MLQLHLLRNSSHEPHTFAKPYGNAEYERFHRLRKPLATDGGKKLDFQHLELSIGLKLAPHTETTQPSAPKSAHQGHNKQPCEIPHNVERLKES